MIFAEKKVVKIKKKFLGEANLWRKKINSMEKSNLGLVKMEKSKTKKLNLQIKKIFVSKSKRCLEIFNYFVDQENLDKIIFIKKVRPFITFIKPGQSNFQKKFFEDRQIWTLNFSSLENLTSFS